MNRMIRNSFSEHISFIVRGLIVVLALGFLMSVGNVTIGAVSQGIAFGLVGITVLITYRVLGFVDLTVDGAFPIGGAATVVALYLGISPEIAILIGLVFGALTGLATALIDIIFKIDGLLASIIVITGAYTITLHIMQGRSNLPLLGQTTFISRSSRSFRAWLVENFGEAWRRQSTNLLEILIFGLIVLIALAIVYWFMRTEMGLAIRATGKNQQMIQATGLNPNTMIVIALMLANGLAGLSGALVVQLFGFADINLGFGLIVRGLAAIILGEALLRPRSIGQMIIAAVVGMLVFDILRGWIFAALNLPPSDVQLVSALVVLAALGGPRIANRWQAYRMRNREGLD